MLLSFAKPLFCLPAYNNIATAPPHICSILPSKIPVITGRRLNYYEGRWAEQWMKVGERSSSKQLFTSLYITFWAKSYSNPPSSIFYPVVYKRRGTKVPVRQHLHSTWLLWMITLEICLLFWSFCGSLLPWQHIFKVRETFQGNISQRKSYQSSFRTLDFYTLTRHKWKKSLIYGIHCQLMDPY